MKKAFAILGIVSILAVVFAMSAYAAHDASPFINNAYRTVSQFVIDTDGTATVSAQYVGRTGLTSGATITMKIQKSVSGSWVDVEIGQPNNTWVDTRTTATAKITHTYTITQRGTYRALITYNISGTGGANDIFTESIEKTF